MTYEKQGGKTLSTLLLTQGIGCQEKKKNARVKIDCTIERKSPEYRGEKGKRTNRERSKGVAGAEGK